MQRSALSPLHAGRSSSCFACAGRGDSEWCSLEGNDLNLLNQAKVANTYLPGQTIFYQGNACLGIFCVESGTVAIRKNDHNGNSVIVRLAHRGDTLGYRSYFAGQPYQANAEALVSARVCFVDKAAVRRLLEHNPSVGLAFLRKMAHNLEDAEQERLMAATLPVRARLAHLLLVMKDRFGKVEDNGDLTIDLPLSRQDIAAMLGARPETVARAVRSLEDSGTAKFKGRLVSVPDLDALMDALELSD